MIAKGNYFHTQQPKYYTSNKIFCKTEAFPLSTSKIYSKTDEFVLTSADLHHRYKKQLH